MKYIPLLWAGLWRKKTRTILTFFSVVVAFVLFGLISGISGGFAHQIAISRLDRLFIEPKFGGPLPLAYQNRLQRLPGVTVIAPERRLNRAYHRDQKNRVFPILTDARFFAVRPEIKVQKADIDAMIADRQGAIVSNDLAQKNGWKVGDKIPVISTISAKDGSKVWTFDIIATANDTNPANIDWFIGNYRYLEDRRADGANGKANRFLIIIDDPKKSTRVAEAIDAMFANSPFPTRSGSERLNLESNLRLLGDINFFTRAIIGAVLFMLLFLTGNTMMQSVRERAPEFAVLKTLGFSNFVILGLVLGEAVLLCFAAGGLGLVLVKAVLPAIARKSQNIGSILLMPWSALAWGLLFALLMAALSSYFPARKVLHLSVVDALRR